MATPMFACKCPEPERCGRATKLGKRGGYYSERRARQSLYDHLVGSPKHHWSHEDACSAADLAEIFESCGDPTSEDEHHLEWEESQTWYDKGGAGGAEGASSGGADRPKRRRLLEDDQQQPRSSSASAALVDSPAAAAIGQEVNVLGHQIREQTRNAYIFVKAMTKAEAALRTAARLARSAQQTFEASVRV